MLPKCGMLVDETIFAQLLFGRKVVVESADCVVELFKPGLPQGPWYGGETLEIGGAGRLTSPTARLIVA